MAGRFVIERERREWAKASAYTDRLLARGSPAVVVDSAILFTADLAAALAASRENLAAARKLLKAARAGAEQPA